MWSNIICPLLLSPQGRREIWFRYMVFPHSLFNSQSSRVKDSAKKSHNSNCFATFWSSVDKEFTFLKIAKQTNKKVNRFLRSDMDHFFGHSHCYFEKKKIHEERRIHLGWIGNLNASYIVTMSTITRWLAATLRLVQSLASSPCRQPVPSSLLSDQCVFV